jgi:hypothetical protein
MSEIRPAVHFVGFSGEEFHSATRVWGPPDFIHRGWDERAQREIADVDTVVFGPNASPDFVNPRSFDDSNQDNDPAFWERLGRQPRRRR